MKTKLINGVLGAIAVALLFGIMYTPTISQATNHIRPTGKTTQQASQLVFWYDEDESTTNSHTHIQVTNASNDTPVNVHVQIFASFQTGSIGDPLTAVICAETDFNDFYTPNDTHTYVMDFNLLTNEPILTPLNVGDFDNTKGFVIITPIDGPGTRNAIAHQHMFGVSLVEDTDKMEGYALAAMGRDAVSFSTGNVVADGTVLDGNANGYVLIQPSILKFNFSDFEVEDIGLVSIAFRDNYEGVFGYVAEPADAVWTPLIFDEDENPISCGALTQNCFFSIGLNDQFGQRNALLSDSIDLCPNNDNSLGWAKIAVSGLDGLENELGIVVHSADQDFGGGAVWMYVE